MRLTRRVHIEPIDSNHKSPLRYPGGKARLVPFIAALYERNRLCDGHYAEPYAGGASVALSLLYGEFARHIHINDIDRSVYSFWWAVLHKTQEFVELIKDAPFSLAYWKAQREVQHRKATAPLLQLGFSTFYLNRTNRSGIITSGGIIGGKRQAGRWKMDARFNKQDLIRRIQRVAAYRDRITVTNLDAIDFLARAATSLPERSLTYLDPPYYVKGQRLYANSYDARDHGTIAETLQSYPHCWLVSYDYHPEVLDLYQRQRCVVYHLPYTAATRSRGSEVMFFSGDLHIPDPILLPKVRMASKA